MRKPRLEIHKPADDRVQIVVVEGGKTIATGTGVDAAQAAGWVLHHMDEIRDAVAKLFFDLGIEAASTKMLKPLAPMQETP